MRRRRLGTEVARRLESEVWHPAPHPLSLRALGPDCDVG